MPEPFSPFVHTVEKWLFLIVLLELLVLLVGGVLLRLLLRTNLTLKPQLALLMTHLKKAKADTQQINHQLTANQDAIAAGLLSVGNALPKPLRWISTLLRWLV
jgi:hypothetical protein